MVEHVVEAQGLSKHFASRHGEPLEVLRDASCTISLGDRIAVVGPSGSGKSTLLAILGGLIVPTSGDVTWPALGDRRGLQPLQVAFVFQTPSLFPPMTVLQNVTLPLVLAGKVLHSTERAEHLLDLFGLADLANKLPEELSGGQAQRVAMVRALLARPKLLIADEPTGQLDTQTATAFLYTVLEQLADTPAALLMATHDAKVAGRMQTRWRMDHGQLWTGSEVGENR